MSYAKLNQERTSQDICAYVLENWRVMTFQRLLRKLGCGARALRGAFKTLGLEPRSRREVAIIKACQRDAVCQGQPPVVPAPAAASPLPPATLQPAAAQRPESVLSALDFLPRKKKKPPQRKFYKEAAVTPDPPKKPFIRPPAVYTNSSPYGIASDMLLHPEKYEHPEPEDEKPEVAYYAGHAVSKKTFTQKRV